MKKYAVLVLGCFLTLADPVASTTWAPAAVTCPVCGAEHEFMEVMSFGSYIYGWPSRYQYLFWPRTEGEFLYTCSTCGYSAYMWDFQNLAADKKDAVAATLEGALPAGDWESYLEIPMPDRLALAERVYRVLGRDDFFWCDYYRILGYHLEQACRPEEAAAARSRSLELAVALAKEDQNAGVRKELLLISGAMRHYLGDDAGALADFDAALAATFEDPDSSSEENAIANENLDGLLHDMQAELAEGPEEPPECGGSPDAGTLFPYLSRGSAEAGTGAATAGGGPSPVGPVPPTSRGCACSTASVSPRGSWTWLLFGLVFVVARRLRRRGSA